MELSPTEFKLLRYLMRNSGRVLSKMQILDHVWDYDFRGDTGHRRVLRILLRRKIDTTEPAPAAHAARGRLRDAAALVLAGMFRMALPSFFSGTWQRFGRLSDRTPLRVKVLTAMLALVGLGLVLISVAGVLVFRDYLTNRADTALRQQYQLAVASTQSGRLQPNTIALGGSYVTAWRLQGRQLQPQVGRFSDNDLNVDLPAVPVSLTWVRAHAGKLVNLHGLDSTDRWEVIVLPTPYRDIYGETQYGTLIVGVNLGDVNGSIARLAAIDAIVGAVLLLGLVAVGFAMVKASLRPLIAIERTAGQIAVGDLTRRVPLADPRTEVGGWPGR